MTPNLSTLIEEIQSDAVLQDADLNLMLRKCKVLAGYVDSTQLDQWSTCETLGYPADEPLPDYRVWPVKLTGEFAGPFGKSKTAPITMEVLPEDVRKSYSSYECRGSITNIEEHLSQAENGLVGVGSGDLHKLVGRKMFRGYKCVNVTAEFSATCLTEVLNSVRDRVISATMSLMQNEREREAALQDEAGQRADYAYANYGQTQYQQGYAQQDYAHAGYGQSYGYAAQPEYAGEPGSGMVLRSQILREEAEQAAAWARARRGGPVH